MADEYREELWKIYKKLPEDLREAISSEDVANSIYSICKRNKAEEEEPEISRIIGEVMLGLLLPEDFQKALEELKIDRAKARKIAVEINSSVFYPNKKSLEDLYSGKINIEGPKEDKSKESKEIPSLRKDNYREPIKGDK